jgi:hypothetical protein
MVICNDYEYDVGMNNNVKFAETWNKNSEHMPMKCKYVVTIMWNILQEFKFHFY